MPISEWSDSFVLGNQQIDSEHQRLMELLAWLEEKLYREEDLNPAQIQSVLEDLTEHVEDHFAHEEAWMNTLSEVAEADKRAHEANHRFWKVKLTEPIPALERARTDLERRAHLARILLVGRAFWREHFPQFDAKLPRQGA